MVEAVHLEAASVETSAVVVLVSAHQDIGQAGFSDTGGTLSRNMAHFRSESNDELYG